MKNRHETATAETPEQLIEHISRLMSEAEAMIAGPHTERATDRLAGIKDRLETARTQLSDVYDRAREQLTDAYGRARKNVVAGAKYTDDTIRTHPYESIGIALAVGVVVGILIGRRNNT